MSELSEYSWVEPRRQRACLQLPRATDLIRRGVSEDRILCLFEVARDRDRVTTFVAEPLWKVTTT